MTTGRINQVDIFPRNVLETEPTISNRSISFAFTLPQRTRS